MIKNKLIGFISNNSEKNKIIIKNVSFSVIIKGLALIISLFSMPTYIKFFNNQVVLGLWFTILSILNWILAFDLGIGNGLRNNLASSIAKKDYNSSRKFISSAYFSIGILSIIMIIIFLLISNFIKWNSLLGISSSIVSDDSLLLALKIVFIGIILQFFLKIITSILYAIQKPFIINLISLVISSTTLVAVLVAPSRTNDINLIYMSIIHTLLTLIPYFICTIYIFTKSELKSIYPSIKYVDKESIKKVLFLGGNFFYIQIMYMIIMATNELLITKLHGAESVVDYSIYYRLFSILGTISIFLLAPIWSLITKVIAEKDYIWVKKLYKKLLLIATIISILEFAIIPILQIVVNFWLKENAITVNYYYSFIFASFGSLMIFNNVLSSIANGMGKLKAQTICFTIGSILKIVLSIIFVNLTHKWIYIMISCDLVILIYCVTQAICIKKYLNNLDYKGKED